MADNDFIGFQTAHPNPVPRDQRQFQPPVLKGPQQGRLKQFGQAMIVAAIDFGTTFTGYAFGFTHDKSRVFTAVDGGTLPADRVPTTVLLKPNGTFHSFGYKAEDDYIELMRQGKHKNWKYFETFKMALYQSQRQITRDIMIKDKEGREMSAILIFSMVIRHLKELLENHVSAKTNVKMSGRDYKWVITVPAISSDSAKQFMREAAVTAGLQDPQLHLGLEPEAGSAYCLDQAAQWQRQYFDRDSNVVEMSRGFKYILADLGGGTADICVHELVEGGNLKEIHCATGDAFGGSYVNLEFQAFLQRLVGADVIQEFHKTEPKLYAELLRDFERKKKIFCNNTKELNFTIPPELCAVIERKTGEKLHQIIPNTQYSGKVEFLASQNKLKISSQVVKDFFAKSVDGIIQKLKDILNKTKDLEIKTLILVGGYSESPYLRECIQAELKQLKVLQEPDARLAVLKGAVILGFKPTTIQQRKAQFTYGFYMIQHFESTEHPQDLKLYHDGTFYCDRIFLKLIEKGEDLWFGKAFKYESTNKVATRAFKTKPFLVRFLRSSKKDPKYCTDEEDCQTIGTISVQPPHGGWPSITHLTLHIIVGETEFVVSVMDKTTGQMYEAEITFL